MRSLPAGTEEELLRPHRASRSASVYDDPEPDDDDDDAEDEDGDENEDEDEGAAGGRGRGASQRSEAPSEYSYVARSRRAA